MPALRQSVVVTILICGILGCNQVQEIRDSLKPLMVLRQQLQEQLPDETLNVVHGTDGSLSIELVNSKLASLPEEERATRTRRIAAYSRNHYGRMGAVQRISVVFKDVSRVAGFTVTSSQATAYAVEELAAATPPVLPLEPDSTDTAAARGETRAESRNEPPRTPTSAPSRGLKSISRWNP
jgi:hypothetical protein